MKKLLKYISIALVIIWMSIVFMLSSQTGKKSENTSNNFTKAIFKNDISDEQVRNLSYIVRKIAHFTLYTIGGILICLCLLLNIKSTKYIYFISFVIGLIYAITDEFHQLFIPNRSGEIKDVIIDSLGILLGVSFVKISKYIIYKLKRSGYNE